MPTVTIPRPDGDMTAHMAVPRGEAPWPGVLVIHDAIGMSNDLRRQAEWLADEGFLAVAPDLYYRDGRARCLFSTMKAAAAGEGRVFEDLEAARQFLVSRDDCTGRVGVIGFCMGGGFAVLLAGRGGYDASSVNYGSVPKDAMAHLAGACPVVGSFGARDRSLRTAPALLRDALRKNGVAHDIKVYADTGHGFLNDHDPGEVPRWALVAGSLVSTGYHEESARDARRRIAVFFHEHLEQ